MTKNQKGAERVDLRVENVQFVSMCSICVRSMVEKKMSNVTGKFDFDDE